MPFPRIMSRLAIKRATLAAAACALCYFGVSRLVKVAAPAPSPVVPFLIEQEVAGISGGQYTVTERRITAFRSNGSEAMLVTRPNHPEAGPSHVVSGPDATGFAALKQFGVRMSGFLSNRRIEAQKARQANPTGDCLLPGEQEIERARLVGIQTIAGQREAGAYRETTWRSPDFGCQTIQKNIERKSEAGWRLSLRVTPLYFAPGNPPDALFDGGYASTFREMPPSQARTHVYSTLGVTAQNCPQCFAAGSIGEQDRMYQDAQRRR